MAALDDAARTQARNIEQTTGRSIDDWVALVKASGVERHGEIVAWLKTEHGFSHGNANFVAIVAKRLESRMGISFDRHTRPVTTNNAYNGHKKTTQ